MRMTTETAGREIVLIDPQRTDVVNPLTSSWLKRFDAAKQELAVLTTVPEVKDIIIIAELAEDYARKAKDTTLIEKAIELHRAAQRRAGELLKAMKARGELYDGRVPPNRRSDATTVKTLKELGVSKDESSHWQRLAATPREKFEAETERRKTKSVAVVKGEKSSPFYKNTAEEEYYTSPEIVEAARCAMGNIDLDPASCERANEVVKAKTYFTREDNGLLQPWEGNVFCNPPYSRKQIDEFVERLIHFYDEGDVTAAILLSDNSTETQWFQKLMGKATAICFPEGRLNWWSPSNDKTNPMRGSAIFYLGPEPEKFCEEFRQFGRVVRCWDQCLESAASSDRFPDE